MPCAIRSKNIKVEISLRKGMDIVVWKYKKSGQMFQSVRKKEKQYTDKSYAYQPGGTEVFPFICKIYLW